jgi:hypothetical protein
MFYKPKFCCECGEKVERDTRKPWTSTRFCENCEGENKIHVLLPRLGLALAAIIGLWGIGVSLPKNEKTLNVTTNRSLTGSNSAQKQVDRQVRPTADGPQNSAPSFDAPESDSPSQAKKMVPSDPKLSGNVRLQEKGNSKIAQSAPGEPVYFCGAQTKKGTPCSRRVKGGGRCWQHAGQTAMLTPEKLLISQ